MKQVKRLTDPGPSKVRVHPDPGEQTTAELSTIRPENERAILLALGNDITRVREKKDLMTVFSRRFEGIFYFTHTIITLIDHKDNRYKPFLLDSSNTTNRIRHAYPELMRKGFSLNEPFIRSVIEARVPLSFVLADIMDAPGSPAFLKINHEAGIREILMACIWNAEKPMGFIHIYSDRTGSFTDEFRNIITGILPQLSGAVCNIISNGELLNKEYEKSLLLDFSNAISTVKTKDQLAIAADGVFNRMNPLDGYMILKINADETMMSLYIASAQAGKTDGTRLKHVEGSKFLIEDGFQNRVLGSPIPLLFNLNLEIRRGSHSEYLKYLKSLGFETIVGIALRNGGTTLGSLWLGTDEINIALLQGICSQLSIAMANVLAHQQLLNKEKEQEFLLDFSNDIAGQSTKANLERAIFKVLHKMLNTKLAMIQLFEEDGINLIPYMFDETLFEDVRATADALVAERIDINELYTARVMKSGSAIAFNIDDEIAANPQNAFPHLWKTTGFKHAYGAPLRAGEKSIGTLWLMADYISPHLLKGLCSQIAVAIANIRANEQLLQYKQQLEEENDYLKEQIKTMYNFSEIIGGSEEMQKVYQLMSMVADTSSTVLILGETGTGKELIARAIHNASSRKEKLMVKVNCAAMPASLVESELFGHERGAFTGAIEKRIGKFELANGSTLFLDEIGEMPLEAQVKLLRVLQEREFERVGGRHTIKTDVRIIAATNRNLEAEVSAGRFRSDLFYRLNVFPILLPPLRDRPADIERLAESFLIKFSKNTGKKITHLTTQVKQQLKDYPWPGNVRELEHLIERSVLMAPDQVLREIYLPKKSGGPELVHGAFTNLSLDAVERNYILQVLKQCKGKISGAGGAAAILNIPGNTLHSKIKKLGISKGDYFLI